MDVLLSWSGEHSKAVASALREWLPKVIPGVKPWMSEEDISKGRSWFLAIMDALSTTRACVICVTPQSLLSPWVFFEAGAIAAKKDESHIFPYLVGMEAGQLTDTPIGQFQCTRCDKDDTLRFVKSVNKALGESAHDESLLETQFKQKWRFLKTRIDAVLEEQREDNERSEDSGEGRRTVFSPTDEEMQILLKAAESDGVVYYIKHDAGIQIMAGGEQLVDEDDPRTLARWQEGIDHVIGLGLLKDIDGDGERFHLSPKGFDVVDRITAWRAERAEDNPFPELERLMPKLLAEMQRDLAAHPLYREVVLLKKTWIYNGGEVLCYYFEDHPDLKSQMQVLENHALVTEVTHNNTKRYRLSEELVKYLNSRPNDTAQVPAPP